jgi:hypothetical protein
MGKKLFCIIHAKCMYEQTYNRDGINIFTSLLKQHKNMHLYFVASVCLNLFASIFYVQFHNNDAKLVLVMISKYS